MLKRLQDPWFAQKLAVVLYLAGLCLLSVEIRFEHQAVLGEKWQAWIPLVYLCAMTILGACSLLRWQSWGRKVLIAGFLAGALVGLAGFWFHCKANPLKAVSMVLHVVSSSPGRVLVDVEGPPVLAPLALVGLSLLAALICVPQKSNSS